MWFKNARLYTVELDNARLNIFKDESSLEQAIVSARFKPLAEMEQVTSGFTPLFGRHAEAYSFSANGNHFFKFTEENKLLPKSVIDQAVADEVENKEEELQRKLTKTEKTSLRTAIHNKLIARAFSTRRDTLLWVNSKEGFACVATTSAKRADNALSALRKALDSFPAKGLAPRCVVEDRLSNFIKGELPEGFALGNDTVLKGTDDDDSVVRISRDDLSTPEVLSHLKSGKVVTEVQLILHNNVSLVLTSDLVAKRIVIDDQYLAQNLPQKSEDAIADLQSALYIQGDVLTMITSELVKNFDCVK